MNAHTRPLDPAEPRHDWTPAEVEQAFRAALALARR